MKWRVGIDTGMKSSGVALRNQIISHVIGFTVMELGFKNSFFCMHFFPLLNNARYVSPQLTHTQFQEIVSTIQFE